MAGGAGGVPATAAAVATARGQDGGDGSNGARAHAHAHARARRQGRSQRLPLASSSASRASALCIALILFCTLTAWLPARAINIVVAPNAEECFFEKLAYGEKMVAWFNVQQGGYLDIDVKVYDPEQKIVYESDRFRDNSFQFKAARAGQHSICFINSMSLVSSKSISFNLYSGHQLLAYDAARAEHLTPLENAIMRVTESVAIVHDAQAYMKFRETRHQSTIESNNSRVLWWNVVELVVLIVISIINIVYLRSLFDGKGPRK